ncbi:hypothetical protein [Lutibacter flavus]|uniref:Uncharacterized protein n=1 Tax=Lutibacter flavus TaxID=691689 RepID=A0A238Y2P3_9FLAO|nr:hypothetical protein [Lutibacter flavus]SNR64589.1 hypothetical protein SAMN04488111_2262 [Lutibacter flavus]
MKKSFLLAFFLMLSTFTFAQKSINSYKYILVPKQFEFQKTEDSYQINSLVKFLFEREGFNVFFENDSYPSDLASDRCLALRVNMKNNSSFLSTKMKMELIDCNNRSVFSSKEVKSKEKDYKKAYQEVVRKSFKDVEALNYTYSGSGKIVISEPVEVLEAEEVEEITLEEEVGNEVVEKEKIEKNVSKPVDKIIDVKEIKGVERAVVVKAEDEIEKRVFKPVVFALEGNYLIDNWGKSSISKKGDNYSVIGGDEHFEFATIYKTSKPNIYIIKWLAFKQPQLLEITNEGNLNIDTSNGIKIYKKVN